MDILGILKEIPVVGDITNTIIGLIPQEPSFLDKISGLFDNMGDVFTQLGNLNFDFSQLNSVFDAIGKLFGA